MTTSTRSRISADDHDCELARTIREFADASLIVKQCANRLGVHVNTVYHGLNRVGRHNRDRLENLRKNSVVNDRAHDSLTARVAKNCPAAPTAASFGGRHIGNDPVARPSLDRPGNTQRG